MKKSFWTVLCASALLLFSTMPAGAFEIGARALYWFPTMNADMRADTEARVGTTLDIKDTLGVDNKSFPTFEAFAGVGKHRLTLAYTPISYSGSATLATPVTFDGRVFAAGTGVNSDLKLRMLDLEYQYKFLDLENILAGFSLSAIGQVKYIDGEARMEAPATATAADVTVNVPVPMVGLGAHIGLLAGLLEARAKVTGVAYSNNYLYEALADLSLTPFPFLDIHGGYKIIGLKIDRNDFFLDSRFAGPYVALTVSF